MLTVKYIDKDHNETLMEAAYVYSDFADGHRRVRLFDELPDDDRRNYSMLYSGQDYDPSAGHLPGGEKVYVMNRDGATVASYSLTSYPPAGPGVTD